MNTILINRKIYNPFYLNHLNLNDVLNIDNRTLDDILNIDFCDDFQDLKLPSGDLLGLIYKIALNFELPINILKSQYILYFETLFFKEHFNKMLCCEDVTYWNGNIFYQDGLQDLINFKVPYIFNNELNINAVKYLSFKERLFFKNTAIKFLSKTTKELNKMFLKINL